MNIRSVCLIIPLLFAGVLPAASDDYLSARRKLDLIEAGRLAAGSRVELTTRELNAYAAHEVPAGVRNPQIQLVAPGVATGTALVDFGRVRRAQGNAPGWLMSKLLDGERPVSVTVRIQSAGGSATVDVERVQVSDLELDGRTLDFVIQNLLLPLYPNAAIGRPFQLGYRIERLEVLPGVLRLTIGR